MFRTCDITGFKVDLRAEKLIQLNAVMAVVSLLVGVIAALLLVLTRWQVVHLLPVEWYYRVLTLHGLNALICGHNSGAHPCFGCGDIHTYPPLVLGDHQEHRCRGL
jgi:hypothetical protein